MREIKFRAWNGLNMVDLYKTTPLALAIDCDGLFLPFHDDYILEQFTGLQDKNGEDIYENDFVYIAGSGITLMSWPFIDLYEAGAENDIGQIKGNVHTHPEM